MNEKDLIDAISSLNISKVEDKKLIESKLLAFSAWKIKPINDLLNWKVTSIDRLQDIMKTYMALDIPRNHLPALKSRLNIEEKITIHPFKQTVAPEPKPNLLLILCTIFKLGLKEGEKRISLGEALKEYDFIMPRKALQKIISNQFEQLELHLYRPSFTGESPLFIDRISSYETNPGSIGMQFEKRIITSGYPEYHRVYGIFSVKMGGLNICITGEVDGVDGNGNIVEVKTKPAWVTSDTIRQYDIWSQCTLGNVSSIVQAGFYPVVRGIRDGPVTFSKQDIVVKTSDMFVSGIEKSHVSRGVSFLERILKLSNIENGKVYRLSGNAAGHPKISLEPKAEFPLSKELIDTFSRLN